MLPLESGLCLKLELVIICIIPVPLSLRSKDRISASSEYPSPSSPVDPFPSHPLTSCNMMPPASRAFAYRFVSAMSSGRYCKCVPSGKMAPKKAKAAKYHPHSYTETDEEDIIDLCESIKRPDIAASKQGPSQDQLQERKREKEAALHKVLYRPQWIAGQRPGLAAASEQKM